LDKKKKISEASLKYYYNNIEKCAEKAKKWRLKNKDYIRDKQRESKRKRKLDAIEYLGLVCLDCGGSFHPTIYDFHHRNPIEKDKDPSKLLTLSWKRIIEELDKCDLLCANCHRLRHHKENYENQ